MFFIQFAYIMQLMLELVWILEQKRAAVVEVEVDDARSENDPSWGENSELQYQTVNKKCALRRRQDSRHDAKNNKVHKSK